MEQLTSPQYSSPREELSSIEQRVRETMDQIYTSPTFEEASPAQRTEVVKEVVDQHVEEHLAQALGNPFGTRGEQKRTEEFILNLTPDEDDGHIHELLGMVREVGVVATLKAIDKTASYHVKDDLHRALVAYIHQGYPVKNLPERDPIREGLSLTLFELYLPVNNDEQDRQKDLKSLLSSMEQFYAGMQSLLVEGKERHYFSVEVALPQGRDEIIIYLAVPDVAITIFKSQVLAIFPNIKLVESTDDYNIFNKKEETAVAVLEHQASPLLPIKTYAEFDYDPLNILLESFSHLEHDEGASIQIVIGPASFDMREQINRAIKEIEQGEEPAQALKIKQKGFFSGFGKELVSVFDTSSKEERERKEAKKKERAQGTDRKQIVEELQKKQSAHVYACNLRLVAAGNSAEHAQAILSGFEASFHQFSAAGGNGFVSRRLSGRAAREMIRQFTFRIYDPRSVVYLGTGELTSLIHFHKKNEASSDLLSQSAATTGGASTQTVASARGTTPGDVVPGKVLLGNNVHQGSRTPIYLAAEDRLRHMYVIGQTGTGKSKLLQNMIVQDIQNGEGCCFIDPHGSDIEEILGNIPESRLDDLIYFDPSDTEKPLGLNMLEYDARFPEQKSFVVNEMFSIFDKLFDMKVGGGAMFEQYFRNATQLAIDDPATGSTLLEISRVLSDASFRQLKLSRCSNIVVTQFWQNIAGQAGGEASLENVVPYIVSKFDGFLGDDIMRPIVGQERSAFNFRQAMDERKIVMVNLSKGRLGEKNANLLGLVIVGKILMAALSRVDAPGDQRPPFYLYIDEFQNVTTDSISQILSEARKYGLSLNVAHQFIKQLDEGIRDAVFGNVGNMASFRISPEDAEFLEKIHTPVFSAQDIANIDNFNAYVKILVKGQPQKSFSLATLPPSSGEDQIRQEAIRRSRERYGRPRQEIEEEIRKKYQAMG